MFDKHFQMQQIIMKYPEEVTDIQYEYESYNFLTLQKSLHISELETSLMILSGCNGMLYNRWEHTQDFLDMMRASAKKWDVLAASSADGKTYGVYCAYSWRACCLNEIGIPVTPHLENACACYVIADEWNLYRDEEIEKMLAEMDFDEDEDYEEFEGIDGSIEDLKNAVDSLSADENTDVENEEI